MTKNKAKATKGKTTDVGLVEITVTLNNGPWENSAVKGMRASGFGSFWEANVIDDKLRNGVFAGRTCRAKTRTDAIGLVVEGLKANKLTGKLRIVDDKAPIKPVAKPTTKPVVMPTAEEAEDIELAAEASLRKAVLLRPGFIVALRTEIQGGVSYERKDLDVRCSKAQDISGAAEAEELRQKTNDSAARRLEAAKVRARDLLDDGDWRGAVASMTADIGRRNELAPLLEGLAPLALAVANGNEARLFVEGFKAPFLPAPEENATCKLLANHEGACDFTKLTPEEITRWETTRVIIDKVEYEEAKKVRSKCNTLIRSSCAQSDFGLVCPGANEKKLDAAYYEARQLMAKFNEGAQHSRVEVNMLKGRIAADDEMAVKGIGVEVRGLIDAMQAGIKAADPKRIRDAANRARKLGQMLDETTQGKVSKAVEEARSAASVIARRVETGGEDAALVVQELSKKALTEARFAFLDLDLNDAIVPASTPAVVTAELEDDDNDDEGGSSPASSFAGRDLEVQ